MSKQEIVYETPGNIRVSVAVNSVPYDAAIEPVIDKLNERRGAAFSSSVEIVDRYSRWDIGFADPPISLSTTGRQFRIEALNERGSVLLSAVEVALKSATFVEHFRAGDGLISGQIVPPIEIVREEDRSRAPTVFSLVRMLLTLFKSEQEAHLGLYGAFAYDLAFQFEAVELHLSRPEDQRDMVLYLPDRIVIVDHMRKEAFVRDYEFEFRGHSTVNLLRDTKPAKFTPAPQTTPLSDHQDGAYEAIVERARGAFARGDMYEVVMGQTFSAKCQDEPATVFRRLRRANPAPYGALINLGEGEFIVSASPEIYVRVQQGRVETCPICGTIKRGSDPVEDADRILELLNSTKDEAELTMCTDVDRNDKSRICIPGSVRVIGRRQIELYSRLIHTVDHIEGILRPDCDSLDAFLSHAWAVTVTGAPKRAAMEFIEKNEKSARRWYGGAIGFLTFDGNLNTGLTLRTMRLFEGVSEVRASATLLYDSVPESENEECVLKASALLASIRSDGGPSPVTNAEVVRSSETGAPTAAKRKILFVDHEDSFVHTLADYFRQVGADVTTMRAKYAREAIAKEDLDLVVLSPGPRRPDDFNMRSTIDAALTAGVPIFGVCLGLQGIVEYFGGHLLQLEYPMHGKSSAVTFADSALFKSLPREMTVGRYHSLYARQATIPAALRIVAQTQDGIPMAIEHTNLPIAAVQFHPESIMSARKNVGLELIRTVTEALCEISKRA